MRSSPTCARAGLTFEPTHAVGAAMTWRPLDDPNPEPRRLGASLDSVTRKLGAPPAAALSAVFAHWADVVGAAVADHCTPLTLSNGTLVVGVYEPGWATQLRFLEADVARRCAEVTGDETVSRVEVKVLRGRPR